MPLGIVAPFIYQGRSLNFLFDSFDEHEEIETVGHGNDRPHDHGWAGLRQNFKDEGLIDFHPVDRQTMQIAER